MNLRQSNTLNMYRAVLTVLDDNTSLYSDNAAFTKMVLQLKTNVATITDVMTKQETTLTGVALDKKQLKQNLSSTAFTVAALVKSFAAKQQLNELKEEIDFTESELFHSRDELFIARCQLILARAEEWRTDLTSYDLTPEMISLLTEQLAEYEDKQSSTRVALNERTIATDSLAGWFKETNLLLKEQMDGAIQVYRYTHSDFFNMYVSSRMIVNVGTRHEGDTPPTTPIN